jgi:hypothetical protein
MCSLIGHEKPLLRAISAIFRELSVLNDTLVMKFVRILRMRFFVAALLATASILAPVVGFAESADVEATIKRVDTKNLSITLDDGKTYATPDDFDFNGLEAGVKVIVFYTEVDGKRVINDLDIVH